MVRYTPERSAGVLAPGAGARRARCRACSRPAWSSPTLPFTFNFNQQEMRVDNRTYSEGQRGEIIENVADLADYLDTLGVPVDRRPRHRRETDIAGARTWR